MLEAVIFDMDGTMIDSELFCYQRFQDYLFRYQIDLDLSLYQQLFAGKNARVGLQAAKEYFHLDYEVNDIISTVLNNPKFDEKAILLKPGLIELLSFLKQKHIKTAIATSTSLERVHRILDGKHVLEYFDEIISGFEVQNGKPAPDIFLKALERLNVKEAIVLEDSEAGILASIRANIPVICVVDLQYPTAYEKQCLQVKNSLLEVKDYLEEYYE